MEIISSLFYFDPNDTFDRVVYRGGSFHNYYTNPCLGMCVRNMSSLWFSGWVTSNMLWQVSPLLILRMVFHQRLPLILELWLMTLYILIWHESYRIYIFLIFIFFIQGKSSVVIYNRYCYGLYTIRGVWAESQIHKTWWLPLYRVCRIVPPINI